MLLAAAVLLASQAARAQELPLPITRPCSHPCVNKIELRPGLDRLTLHARIVPATGIDPTAEPFTIELSDAGQTLFTATVPPGNFVETAAGRRWALRNPAARTTGGLFRVLITQRNDGAGGYRVDVVAYGDLSAATTPDMSLFLVVGDDGFFDAGPWTQRVYGWSRDFAP